MSHPCLFQLKTEATSSFEEKIFKICSSTTTPYELHHPNKTHFTDDQTSYLWTNTNTTALLSSYIWEGQEGNKWSNKLWSTIYTLNVSSCCSFRLLTAADIALVYLSEIQTGSEPLNASSTFSSIFCWLCRIELFMGMTEPLVHASVFLWLHQQNHP